MGYVLQFGEIGHRTAPYYYYTNTDPVMSMMGGAEVMGVASVICDGCGRWWVMWWLLVWWVWLWLISEANVNGETDVMAVAGMIGTSWCSWLWWCDWWLWLVWLMEWFDWCIGADLMTGVIEVMGVPRMIGGADVVWCDYVMGVSRVVGRADVVWCDRGDGCAYSGG